MQLEIENTNKQILELIDLLKNNLDYNFLKKQIEILKNETEKPGFWNNHNNAQKIMKEIKITENKLFLLKSIELEFNELNELIEMAFSENENLMIEDLSKQLKKLKLKCEKYKIQTMFDDKKDFYDCFIEIHAGAGGTEAQDWALMLQRMYLRWSEKKGFKSTLIEESVGEEAGIKSTTLKFSGNYSFGWTRTETGVHRLVRISPFDSSARRHTSFASVWVYPDVDDEIEIAIEDKDLKIDTYRASGAGGQHVNKTDSAIRITHLPTNLVVQCQSDRSQHRNKAQAMKMLKAKLYEMELKKKEKENEEVENSKVEIGWGSQIRSYVLHPYNMVKDLRTNVETGNTNAVLDGDLDLFINNALAKKI